VKKKRRRRKKFFVLRENDAQDLTACVGCSRSTIEDEIPAGETGVAKFAILDDWNLVL
jgi:hypothetical protein